MEATRNLVEGEDHDAAAALAASITAWMGRSGHSVGLAAFAGEILARLPLDSQAARGLAQLEADANEALGLSGAAEARWREVIVVESGLAAAEPDRADYQRDLSVSYNKLGDLMRGVGRGEEAARLYQQSLDIARGLAAAEPDRADYQRDLSISLHRTATLLASEGDGVTATVHLAEAVALAEQAVRRSPEDGEVLVDLAYLLSEAVSLDGGSAELHARVAEVVHDLRGREHVSARGQQLLAALTATEP